MGNDSKHIKFASSLEGHKPVKGEYDGGACLNGRCCSAYKEVSCSYRWQAIQKARENKEYYNIETDDERYEKKFHVAETSPPQTRIDQVLDEEGSWKSISIRGAIMDVIERPAGSGNDFAKSGKYKGKQVKRRDYTFVNFTRGKIPYENQVHHVIACAELCDAIMEYADLKDVIGIGLLEEKYNINHKDNAIILPASEKFSRVTGLPTHMGSHGDYSERIGLEIANAFSGYESLDEQSDDEDHEEPDPLQVKQELLDISNEWYQKIIDYIPKNKRARLGSDVVTINEVGNVTC